MSAVQSRAASTAEKILKCHERTSIGWAKARLCAVPTRSRARLLSKIPGEFADISAPVRRQIPTRDVVFETTVRPIADTPDQPVFHGIEVNVINVAGKIGFVANRMFPISALPQSSLALGELARAARFLAGQPCLRLAVQ